MAKKVRLITGSRPDLAGPVVESPSIGLPQVVDSGVFGKRIKEVYCAAALHGIPARQLLEGIKEKNLAKHTEILLASAYIADEGTGGRFETLRAMTMILQEASGKGNAEYGEVVGDLMVMGQRCGKNLGLFREAIRAMWKPER